MITYKNLCLFVAAGFLFTFAGCSDDGGEGTKPCPPDGLGIKSSNGVLCSTLINITDKTDPKFKDLEDCQTQLVFWKNYDCQKPQLCVDHGSHVIRAFSFEGVGGVPENIAFGLTNCTTGKESLTITKVEFTGDKQCNFEFNPTKDIEKMVIDPGVSVYLRAKYKPQMLGEDHGHFRLETNAQNFGKIVLPVCGKAVPKYSPGMDSGVVSGDAGVPQLDRCKDDPSPVVESCHK